MKARTALLLATTVLLSGVTAASAASMSPASSSTMSQHASDTLNLTSTQRKAALKDLNSEYVKQRLPAGFTAAVGSVVPSAIIIEPVPSKAASDVPSLRPYDFAVVQGKVLIVNPSDRKIADVITS
jgi:hypothetical protein